VPVRLPSEQETHPLRPRWQRHQRPRRRRR
jgi:hypothetical protein